MEEFSSTANPDFTVVQDGHDGQTEEEKREQHAAADNGNDGKSEPQEKKTESRSEDPDSGAIEAARRSGESAGYARAMKEVRDRISKTGMRNPESGEVIGDIEGLESFAGSVRKQRIAARAKREGRTEAEVEEEEANKEFLSQSRREAAERKKADEEAARQMEWIEKDLGEFKRKYPDVDVGKLDGDKAFRRFCGSRYGKEPLAGLYGDYLDITQGAAKAGAARSESKDSRSTSGSRTGGGVTLSSEQKAALEDWNRRYPNMKMTENEFASRG